MNSAKRNIRKRSRTITLIAADMFVITKKKNTVVVKKRIPNSKRMQTISMAPSYKVAPISHIVNFHSSVVSNETLQLSYMILYHVCKEKDIVDEIHYLFAEKFLCPEYPETTEIVISGEYILQEIMNYINNYIKFSTVRVIPKNNVTKIFNGNLRRKYYEDNK